MPPFVISRCTRQSLGSCNLLCPRGTRSRRMTWCFWTFWMPWYAMLILRYHCEKYGSCQKQSSKKTKRKTKRKATDRLCTVSGDPWGSHGNPMRSHALSPGFSSELLPWSALVAACGTALQWQRALFLGAIWWLQSWIHDHSDYIWLWSEVKLCKSVESPANSTINTY